MPHDALHTNPTTLLARGPFTIIIAGGGTAGLTLAARLTEDPRISVAVLEAGPCHLDDVFVDTPAMFTQMFGKPEYDWALQSVPQRGDAGRVHSVVRGRMLGGCSGINYCMYVRGVTADYRDWDRLVGGQGIWTPEQIMEGMRRSETLYVPNDNDGDKHNSSRNGIDTSDKIDTSTCTPFPAVAPTTSTHAPNHGTSGPIHTSFNPSFFPIETAAIAALQSAAGTKPPRDAWGGEHTGFFHTLGTVYRSGPHKGRRSYAARGYFEPARARPNLHVLCGAVVDKVLLRAARTEAAGGGDGDGDGDGDGEAEDKPLATGLSFRWGTQTYELTATHEVIISAGALHTPTILERSGIGSPAVLAAANIPVAAAVPGVGALLQDHVSVFAQYSLRTGVASMDDLKSSAGLAAAAGELERTGGGVLTGVQSAQGFVGLEAVGGAAVRDHVVRLIRDPEGRSVEDGEVAAFEAKQLELQAQRLEAETDADGGSLQIIVFPVAADFERGVEDQSTFFTRRLGKNETGGLTFAIVASCPSSRGSVHIKDSDPMSAPTLDPNYLSHPSDIPLLSTGLELVHRASLTAPLSGYLQTRTFPAASIDLDDASARTEAARSVVMGTYHACGSCAMGLVVDARLRVRRVRGLRVVDASVFPANVGGNICATVYAVAEVAADILREDLGEVGEVKM